MSVLERHVVVGTISVPRASGQMKVVSGEMARRGIRLIPRLLHSD